VNARAIASEKSNSVRKTATAHSGADSGRGSGRKLITTNQTNKVIYDTADRDLIADGVWRGGLLMVQTGVIAHADNNFTVDR
jgi:hypothetical protein